MGNRITIWLFCFCAIAMSAVFWPTLPSKNLIAVAFSVVMILSLLILLLHNAKQPNKTDQFLVLLSVIAHGALTGMLWLASVGHLHYAWQLPKDKIQQDVTILARVLSGGCLQHNGDGHTSSQSEHKVFYYTVEVEQLNQQSVEKALSISSNNLPLSGIGTFKARLSHNPHHMRRQNSAAIPFRCLQDGDTFSAQVKLKPAYGAANPVGLNQQKLMVGQGIHATGYIKSLDVLSIRAQRSIRNGLSEHLVALDLRNTKWWLALLLGIRSELSNQDWELLQRTGTGHLFSISGMHLGIVAACVVLLFNGTVLLLYWLGMLLTERSTLYKRASPNVRYKMRVVELSHRLMRCMAGHVAPIRFMAMLSVIAIAYAYTVLSGMALPVVRAFVLLSVACVIAVTNRVLRPLHIALFMVFALILLFPLGLLNASFYLSVVAVLVIWFVHNTFKLSLKPWYLAAICIQVSLSVLKIPISLLWFSSASAISVLANMVAVPIVTVLLPIALLSLLGQSVFPALKSVIVCADYVLSWLFDFLTKLSNQHFVMFDVTISTAQSWCIAVLVLLLALPRFRARRWSVALLALPLLSSYLVHNDNVWYMHVMDAGQASAVAITKGQHALIIDSGASYQGVARTAEEYLLPMLSDMKIRTIDYVFHTHSDMDHAGGLSAVKASPLARNALYFAPTDGCERGKVILWQGLTVTMLWPMPGNKEDSNAQSCVLHISDGNHSVLIAGDIERTSEYALLTQHNLALSQSDVTADVLVAPHHGSRTSSTNAFISAVSPRAVIYTQGYENRWKFPAKAVVERYRKHNVTQFLTSVTGYVRVSIEQVGNVSRGQHNSLRHSRKNNAETLSIETMRHDISKRWYMPSYSPRHL
jgi:competence protein ComEC